VLAGLALNWLMPLPFLPAAVSAGWLGAIVFALALALVAWAISTMTRAGSNVPTNPPTTTIVEAGPYRLTRNPIYLGMVLGLIGLAIAFNRLCDHPRGSVSRAQVRGRLSPLPRAGTTLGVGLVGQKNAEPRSPYPAAPATQNGMGAGRRTV
jgi:Phospholipid methyltransferase